MRVCELMEWSSWFPKKYKCRISNSTGVEKIIIMVVSGLTVVRGGATDRVRGGATVIDVNRIGWTRF